MLDKLPQASARRLPFPPEPASAPALAETPTVAPASSHEPQRHSLLLRWLGLLVLLPAALASIYFGLIASEPFVVEVRFAVRGSNSVPSGDLLRSHRGALGAFRDMHQEFDLTKLTEARYSLLGNFQEALSPAKTKLGDLRSFVGKDALGVLPLNSEIASLQRQLAEEHTKLGKVEATAARRPETLGGLVANYDELVVDRAFADRPYLSALSSLERTRVDADRQQRNEATFVPPTLAEETFYPRRIVASITLVAVALVLWVLGGPIVYASRDHAL